MFGGGGVSARRSLVAISEGRVDNDGVVLKARGSLLAVTDANCCRALALTRPGTRTRDATRGERGNLRRGAAQHSERDFTRSGTLALLGSHLE